MALFFCGVILSHYNSYNLSRESQVGREGGRDGGRERGSERGREKGREGGREGGKEYLLATPRKR
jgi:predicted transposase YdaD